MIWLTLAVLALFFGYCALQFRVLRKTADFDSQRADKIVAEMYGLQAVLNLAQIALKGLADELSSIKQTVDQHQENLDEDSGRISGHADRIVALERTRQDSSEPQPVRGINAARRAAAAMGGVKDMA